MSDPGPSFPGSDQIADAILSGLSEVIRQALDTWWDTTGPVILGRAAAVMFGAFVTYVWQSAGPFLSAVQVFTRIPPQWTTDLAPLAQFHQNARPIAGGMLSLVLLISLVMGAVSLLAGRPFPWLFRGVPLFLVCTAALVYVGPVMRWWIVVVNALSDSMFSSGGLPGFDRMEAVDRLAATGVIGLLWLVFGVWFFVKRVMLIGFIVALWIAAPFALVAGAIPHPRAQQFFGWWLTGFVAATIVQVLQAGLLVVGGYMVAAPVVTGGSPSDPIQDLAAAGVGGAMILCAAWLPGFLLGGVTSATGGAGIGRTLQMATFLASFGGGAWAGRTAVHAVYGAMGAGAAAGSATAYGGTMGATSAGLAPAAGAGIGGGAAPPMYATVHAVQPSVHVRSLLAGAPLALPSPAPQLPK